VGVVRTLEIFQGTHILGASRGGLCHRTAFLLYICSAAKTACLLHKVSLFEQTREDEIILSCIQRQDERRLDKHAVSGQYLLIQNTDL